MPRSVAGSLGDELVTKTGVRALRHALLAGSCLVALASSASARTTSPTLDPTFVVDRWTVEDGLPLDTLSAVAQTPDGFLWVASFDGLARFDGLHFEVFRQGRLPSLPHDRFADLAVDREGVLWAITESGHLLRHRDGRFEAWGPEPEAAVGESLVRAPDGALWVTGWAHLLRLGPDGPRPWLPDLVQRPWGMAWGVGGVLYVGSRTQGLLRVPPEGRPEVLDPGMTGSGTDSAIYEAPDGSLLLADGTGFVHRRESGTERLTGSIDTVWAAFPRIGATTSGEPVAWTRGAPARWWVGDSLAPVPRDQPPPRPSGAGPWRFNGNGLYFGDRLVLTGVGQSRTAIPLVDQDGHAWVPLEGRGLLQVRRASVQAFAAAGARPVGPVYPVLADEGAIWAGTRDGVARLEDGAWRWLDCGTGDLSLTLALMRDRRGRIWAGTGAGLRVVDGERCEALASPPPTTGPASPLFEDSRGRVWIGNGYGLVRGDPAGDGYRWTVVERRETFAPWRTAVELPGGALLFGTASRGVARVTDRPVEWLTTAGGLPSDAIRYLYLDSAGAVWITTEGRGLCRWLPGADATLAAGTVGCLDVGDGLFDGFIHAIAEDTSGRFWMSTNRGLFHVHRAALEARLAGGAPVVSVAFGVRDGMVNREANGARQPPVAVDGEGRVWFPTMEGVVAIDPAQVQPTRLPQVLIDRVVAGGEASAPQRHPAPVVLPAGRRSLEVAWVAPEFARPDRLTFRRRLRGLGEWSQPSAERRARWEALPPGDYMLEVQARLDGRWGPATSLAVSVPPVFQETAAFPMALLVGVALLLLVSVRARSAALRRRARHLEVLVAERSSELAARNERISAQALELERRNQQVAAQAAALTERNVEISAQAARLAELDALKTHFLATASHELRTPLALISGALQDLDELTTRPQARRRLELGRRNADRLEALIAQLLDVARAEAGGLLLRARRCDLGPVVRRIAERFSGDAERRRVALVIETPATPLRGCVDDDLFDKALANLIANALEFTPDGGRVRVELVAPPSDAPEGHVEIRVRDTGEGIPAEDHQRIFERFVSDRSRGARAMGGMGLGLSLVQDIARLHGGEVTVASIVGEGSTFTLRLPPGAACLRPCARRVEGVRTETARSETTPGRAPGGAAAAASDVDPAPLGGEPRPLDDALPRALVVEDNPDMLEYFVEHLEARFTVDRARSGAEALALAAQRPPAVIVSDVMMPEVDGVEMCRRLREDPALARIPVLLVSAKGGHEARLEGLAVADDYLAKPFAIHEVVTRAWRLAQSADVSAGVAEVLASARDRVAGLEAENPSAKPLGMRERLSRVARFLQRGLAPDPSPESPSPEDEGLGEVDRQRRDKLEAIIAAHWGDAGFGVTEMAKAMAYSRRQLLREVQRIWGESPSGLLRARRMEEGRRLIRSAAVETVSEAAARVGLSPAYFSRTYSAWYGAAPSVELSARGRPAA